MSCIRQSNDGDGLYMEVECEGIIIPDYFSVTECKETAIGYIAGFVVRMVKKHVAWDTCKLALEEADGTNTAGCPQKAGDLACRVQEDQGNRRHIQLIKQKNRGGLCVPSASVSHLLCDRNCDFSLYKYEQITPWRRYRENYQTVLLNVAATG